MAKIIGLPKLSPTMEEGTLVEWTKKEGDAIEVDELLAEVETDKATIEFRSFDSGVLLKILAQAGDTLAPGAPVAIVGKAGEDISALLAQAASSAPTQEAPPQEAAAPTQAALTQAAPAQEAAAPAQAAPAPPQEAAAPGGRILASPLVRRLAREQGLELSQLQGSGPRGRVIKRDLDGAQPSQIVVATGHQRLPPRVEKASSVRKTIARRLTESKQNVPHFYLTIDLDAAPLVAARAQMNASLKGLSDPPEKVSFNDLVIKASALALRRLPECNASWMGDAIHYHQVVDISVAVAIPDGLVTPVVRDADQKGVLAISREVRELADRARKKKLRPEEMQNGTFSISNLGMYGVEEFSAIINPPEGALLAVGALRDAPIVRDGAIAAGKKMKVTLSCDHRVIDGALGARYLAELQRLLEAPAAMLL